MSKSLAKRNRDMEIKKAVGEEFHYSGYFEWPGVYDFISGWLIKNQLKLYEKVYKDKLSKDGFTEREMTIVGEKTVDRMNKYQMTVIIKMWDCQDVEVTKDGITQKLCRGRFRVRIGAKILRDYQNLFNKNDFWIKMWGVYDKLMTYNFGFDHYDYWFTKSHDLHQALRDYLKTET